MLITYGSKLSTSMIGSLKNRLSQYVVPGPSDPHPNLTMAGPWTAKQRLLGVYHGPLEETQQKRFGGRTWIQNAFSEEIVDLCWFTH